MMSNAGLPGKLACMTSIEPPYILFAGVGVKGGSQPLTPCSNRRETIRCSGQRAQRIAGLPIADRCQWWLSSPLPMSGRQWMPLSEQPHLLQRSNTPQAHPQPELCHRQTLAPAPWTRAQEEAPAELQATPTTFPAPAVSAVVSLVSRYAFSLTPTRVEALVATFRPSVSHSVSVQVAEPEAGREAGVVAWVGIRCGDALP